jgi:hypothetical protein
VSVVIVSACAAILGATLLVLAVPAWRTHFAAEPAASYQVGEAIDIPTAIYSGSALTLAVFGDASCPAARSSQSAFRWLVAEFSAEPRGHAVLIGSSDSRRFTDQDSFAKAIGLDRAAVHEVDLSQIRLRAVPATMVLDRNGRILAFHEGALTDADAQRLLTGLPKPAPVTRMF